MSKVYETLHRKNDTSVEVYPNIESQNIPNLAVTSAKIADSSVLTTKIADGAVTSAKIANNAITSNLIQNGAVGYDQLDVDLSNTIASFSHIYDEDDDRISCDSIDVDTVVSSRLYLGGNLICQGNPTFSGDFKVYDVATFLEVPVLDADTHTYAIIVGENEDQNLEGIIGFTNCDLSSYNSDDINEALDFDQVDASHWTRTYISILEKIFAGLIGGKYGYGSSYKGLSLRSSTRSIVLYPEGSETTLEMFDYNNNYLFKFVLNSSTHRVVQYVNTNYVYFTLVPVKMFD